MEGYQAREDRSCPPYEFQSFLIDEILVYYLDFLKYFIKSCTWLLWQTNFLCFILKDILNILNTHQSALGQMGQPHCRGSLQRLAHV